MNLPSRVAALAALWMLAGCSAPEPLPIGAPVRIAKATPCAPSEAALEQALQAEKASEREYYRVMDQVQGIELKIGDTATVITSVEEHVRIRLAPGTVTRLKDNTCWVERKAIGQ